MGKLGIFDFLREQLSRVAPVTKADLTGKTVIVIGANTGLGFEACKHFALMNPGRLILGCRSKSKGEAAIEKLQKETGYKTAELWLIDLSEFSSVTAFADKFEKEGGRLDILVANAAIVTHEYTTTSDGWETSLQVNCLSLFLLALRLLPQIVKTSAEHATHPRIVFVTSELHFWSKIVTELPKLEDVYETLSTKESCTPTAMADRYQDTKLFDILFYQALNERLGAQSPIIVNGVNPGFCLSEIRREFSGVLAAAVAVMETLIARTTEQGSRQLVYAAVGGAGNEDKLRGAYISCAHVSEASDFAIGPEGHVVQDRLWTEVIHILTKADPRAREVAEKYLSSNAL